MNDSFSICNGRFLAAHRNIKLPAEAKLDAGLLKPEHSHSHSVYRNLIFDAIFLCKQIRIEASIVRSIYRCVRVIEPAQWIYLCKHCEWREIER